MTVSTGAVVAVLADSLSLGKLADAFTEDTLLLGAIPELDSMAVVNVITEIEERFGVRIEDDELSAETFATVGSLRRFISGKLGV